MRRRWPECAPTVTRPIRAWPGSGSARLRGGDGLADDARLRERQLTVGRVDQDGVAWAEAVLQQPDRQLVDQLLLDHALQRARAVGRVVAQVADQRAGIVGQLDLDAALAHPADERVDLHLDDRAD